LRTIGLAAGARTTITMLDQTTQAIFIDGTVVRIRGALSVALTAIGTMEELAAGIIVVSNEAAAAGSGSMPDPGVDTAADWLWHFGFHISGNAIEQDESQVARVIIDNRSMRKLPGANKRLMFIAKNTSTVAMDLGFFARSLVKLH